MNILITGSSRGIGYELTKIAAKQNGNRIIIISRNKNKLDLLAKECKSINSNSEVIPIGFDLGNSIEYTSLLNSISQEIDSLDIVINNAGFLIAKPFTEMNYLEDEQIFKVNVLGPMKLIRCCMPLLLKSSKAHIVNISSMGGVQGSVKFSGLSSYASSKAAIAVFTECLAEELKHTQIKTNCLALGAVATEMLAEAFPGYQASTTSLEMAEYIWNFATNGHNLFNGKIIPVSNSTP